MSEIIMNKTMAKLMDKIKKNKIPENNIRLKINEIINIEKNKDCFILIIGENELIEYNDEFIFKQFGSFSAYEDYENHIHISDIMYYLGIKDCTLYQTLEYGLIIKEIIKNKLEEKFPNNKFIMVFSCDETDKINTILRFYKYRENEEELYDQDFINNFDICKNKAGYIIENINWNK
jgi:hypothetical protein